MLMYIMVLQFYSKQLFRLWIMLSFLEFDFKWFVDYVTTLNEVHAIHT